MSNNKLPPERLRAESELRVQRALARIQRAQNELGYACADLSSLVGGIPVWRASSKLYDRVRALWYQVEAFQQRGRFRLDDTNVDAILRREQEGRDDARHEVDSRASREIRAHAQGKEG